MSSRRSARAPPAVADHTASSRRHAHVAHGDRDAERHARGVARARVAVGRERDGHARVDHAAGRRGTAPGSRTPHPAAASRRCRCRRAPRGRRRSACVQWSADAAPTSTATATPAPCWSWLAWMRGCEAASHAGAQDLARLVGVEGAAVAEHVDPARVRRAGVEHRPGDERDVGVGVVGELGRHDVGAEEGGLVGDARRRRAATAPRRRPSARSRTCVSNVVMPLRRSSRDEARAVRARARRRRRRGCARPCVRMPPAA